MNFRKHSELSGRHALFSPSKYTWINKDEAALAEYIQNEKRKELGIRLHRLRHEHIELNLKMPRSQNSLNQFINDRIGYRMTSEQPLFYSNYVFGTSDAISFDKNRLRIHDLKTGKTPAHMEQLVIYAALFCLEYGINPKDIETELNIYQSNDILTFSPTPDDIREVSEKIILRDKIAQDIDMNR